MKRGVCEVPPRQGRDTRRRVVCDEGTPARVGDGVRGPQTGPPVCSSMLGTNDEEVRRVARVPGERPPPPVHPPMGPPVHPSGPQRPIRTSLAKSKFCAQFQAGACRLGDQCRYAHGLEELGRHPLYKTRTCFQFERSGRCRDGDFCVYAHGIADMRVHPAYETAKPMFVPEPPPRVHLQMRNAPGAITVPATTTSVRVNFFERKTTDVSDAPKTTGMTNKSKNRTRTAAIEMNARLASAQTAQDVLCVLRDIDIVGRDDFDGVCVATAFHKLAKCCSGTSNGLGSNEAGVVRSSEFRELLGAVRVKEMAVRNQSNVIWACAKMMPAIAGCAELKPTIEWLVDSIAQRLVMIRTQGKSKDKVVPQNLSNILWALAELRVEHVQISALIGEIERHMIPLMPNFQPQNISNALLSLAKLNHRPSDETLEVVEVQIEKMNAELFTPQALSNILYGLGTLNVGRGGTYDTLVAISMRKLESFNAQNAAMVLKGLALRGHPPRVFGCLEQFASVIVDRGTMGAATPQNLSDTIWSLSKLGLREHRTFDAVTNKFIRDHTAKQQQPPVESVLNIVWSYGAAGLSIPPELVNWASCCFH